MQKQFYHCKPNINSEFNKYPSTTYDAYLTLIMKISPPDRLCKTFKLSQSESDILLIIVN